MQLHWKPSSHRLTRFSLVYLLLPPRSVLMYDQEKITLSLLHIIIPLTEILNTSHQLTRINIYKKKIIFLFILPFICLYTFSAINFQGYCICPVSCYTLLSRFQLPWQLSGCLNTTTLFMVSKNECIIWHI
jgi:hypothetical protein